MRRTAGLVIAGLLTMSLPGCFTDIGSRTQTIRLDGSSAGAAIPVSGVDAEYQWLATHRPGWHPERQSLVTGPGGRFYDVMTITRGGQREDVYFDISSFFGKAS